MDDAGHFPVLRKEVTELLVVEGTRTLLDCTVGLGGHAESLLEAAGEGAVLIGIDLDESNLLKTKERLARFGGRVRLFAANFADVDDVLAEAGVERVDAILADLGVASTQLDDPSRGFSFQADGPLDMRMGREGPTAAELVNTLGEKELADLIRRLGEDRFSRRIARAIVRGRREGPIDTTVRLAGIVMRAYPPARGRWRIHPATRTFQALRIRVNRELENLSALLERVPGLLGVGGRAAVISFHSLEDRLVKRSFASAVESGSFRSLTPKPLRPGAAETDRNPPSRSAKLRVMERIR
ncbi:MAG TPA: 16S rRNA (cytosine(1402)-N(4))-methyltransferase RsmH [Phycisphaerae bacterium]|nr:16S rRNA (cytosine(1402)-N(4))-methyltransferase RsmH [Phycisphaerae bacterium]